MLTQVFWDEPVFGPLTQPRPAGPQRKCDGVQLPGAGGVNDSNLVFRSGAGGAAGARIFCAREPGRADARALRSIATGRVQSRRAARAMDRPGLDSGFCAQAGEQIDAAADRHSRRDARTGARDPAGASESAVSELDQADHGAGDGLATHECAGRGERRNAGGRWSAGSAGSDSAERLDGDIDPAGVRRRSQVRGRIDRRAWTWITRGRRATWALRLRARMCGRR